MCGIAGFLSQAMVANADLTEHILSRMTETMSSRGPDGYGTWHDGKSVGLGHRRLAILDLSESGHQPMLCHTGRYVITYNGEIYNHSDLRKELETNGDAPGWRGHSDTEVLIACIRAWGMEKTLRKCIGMFAMAVWDREESILTLARDRVGEKPLYYGWQGEGANQTFLFGSDLYALRAYPAFKPVIERESLSMLMHYGYIPAPHTIYKGIFKLEAGKMLSVSGSTLKSVGEAFWDLPGKKREGVGFRHFGIGHDPVRELGMLLKASVKRQMAADVEVGAFLSGGIDSSLIVAIMQSISEKPVKTFTVGFEEEAFDEAKYARDVARHLGTDHTELCLTSRQALKVIPRLPTLYSEPFSDPSQIPTLLVSELARGHVKVSLSGDGGDELFGGYDRYRIVNDILSHRKRPPIHFRRRLMDAIRSLPEGLAFKTFLDDRKDRFQKETPDSKSSPSFQSRLELYSSYMTFWRDPSQLVIGSNRWESAYKNLDERFRDSPNLEFMMTMDFLTYLPDDILVKVDRAAMGLGLETRMPFLDHGVVEYALRLPLKYKFRNGTGKWILKRLLREHIPEAIFERPKMGFNIPLDHWLRAPLRDWAEALLDTSRLKREGFLDHRIIRMKWDEHIGGKRNWGFHIWTVLMFQAWLEAQGNIPPMTGRSNAMHIEPLL
jgi:asparagine synthase (glutamine-hydrolysing)